MDELTGWKKKYFEWYVQGVELWNSLEGSKLPRIYPARAYCHCKTVEETKDDEEGQQCVKCGYLLKQKPVNL